MLSSIHLKSGLNSIQKEDITAIMNEQGYVWLKNTGLTSASDFHPHEHKFIDTPMQNYPGSLQVRQSVGGHLMTPGRSPKNAALDLHQEMSDFAVFPHKIVFVCMKPADQGGESVIAGIKDITDSLFKSLYHKMLDQKIMNRRFYFNKQRMKPWFTSNVSSWQDAFRVNDRLSATRHLDALNYHYVWHADDLLETMISLPNKAYHSRLGRDILFTSVWYNFDLARSRSFYNKSMLKLYPVLNSPFCVWEDGQVVTAAEYQACGEAAMRNHHVLPLKVGDVLLLDNLLWAHGRLPFQGDRKLYVLLGDARSHDV